MKSQGDKEKYHSNTGTLPSLQSHKVEKANMFLVNPKNVSPDDEESSQFNHSESSEPWLELMGNSETVRKQRVIEA